MMVLIGLNLLALLLLVAYVARRAFPLTEAVRMRNALLLEASTDADFRWAPPAFPACYKVERHPATSEFRAIVEAVAAQGDRSDWQRSLLLARHLTECAADKGPLQADLPTTYRGIRSGYGYCADFVKVYLALAHAAGITARQWAFSFDGFGGHGHTFVEIYDRQRQGWLCLDVHNNFHFVERATGEPLDALRMRQLMGDDSGKLDLAPNGPGRMVFRYPEKAVEYYRRGLSGWYMWWGNAVFTYYGHPAVLVAVRVSAWLAHLIAIVAGLQPRIRILCTPENEVAVAMMFALRRRLILIGSTFALLVAALVLQLALVRAHGH
ncbi:MAG: transglutaminase domain-containing protein [Casimicrobiaceae bacterium]